MNRRRLLLRLAVASLVALLVVVAIGVLTVHRVVHWLAVRQLAATTERPVTIDAVDVSLLRGRIEVRGLRIADSDGGTLASVARIEGRIRLASTLVGRLRVLDALVDGVRVSIVRTGPREFNISHLFAREQAGKPFTGTVTIDHFALRDGAVVIEDRTRTPARVWRVDGIEGELRDTTTLGDDARGVMTLRAKAGDAPISADVSALHLRPLRFRATIAANGLDVALATLALPPAGPITDVGGTAIASASIERDAAGLTRAGVDVVLAGISLYRPEQTRAMVSVPALKATADVRASPGAVEIAYASATMGAIAVEDARPATPVRWTVEDIIVEVRNLSTAPDAPPGVATLSAEMERARVDVYAANVHLSPPRLHATAIVRNADVTLVRLAIPQGLPATPERGVVQATVRIDHDEQQGTRLALDAAVNNLVVRRPEHLAESPEIRVTAEDISVTAGAVAVGRVNVTAARLTLDERTATPPRRWLAERISLEAKDLSSRRDHAQGVGTFRATVAGASVVTYLTQIRLAPLELHATANLRNVDLGLVRLYLPPRAAVRRASGVADATINVDHTEAAGTRISGDAVLTKVGARVVPSPDLRLDVSAPSLRVTIADARRKGNDVSVGRVEITGSGSAVDRRRPEARVDLTELRAVSEGLTWPARGPTGVELHARYGDRSELEVKGTAQLTAPPPDLAWKADLNVRLSRVDLAPVGAWVPAASGIGGRLRGTLTASLAYAGSFTARVRGDVAGGRFTLAEGDRTLLALRRIDVTGLDVEWPERITIKTVKLQQPFLLLERDRQGRYPLTARLGAPPDASAQESEAAAPAARRPAVAVEEISVDDGSVAIQDDAAYTPVRLTVSRVALTVRDATWPGVRPARITLAAQLPRGGTAKAEGTIATAPAPMRVDLQVTLADAELPLIQPYLAFRARLRGRVDATVSVAGPVQPLRVAVRGDATVKSLVFAEGGRRVLTVDRLGLEGIDAAWPERVTIARARAKGSWAQIERDRQGEFLLRHLLERPRDRTPAAPESSASGTDGSAPLPAIAFLLEEAIFEDQAATIVDAVTTPPTRVDVIGARLHVQNLAWPSRGPVKIDITSPMPSGGTVQLTGTGELDPVRLDVRASMKDVAIEPAQPYLPIEGRVAGQVTGELGVKLTLAPTVVQVRGDAQLRRFTLSDGGRPVITVARVDTTGIAIDWPKRIAVGSVRLRAPRLLVERAADGHIVLQRLITPRWAEVPAPATPAGAAAKAEVASSPPAIEVANLTLERASGRFVDQTTTPTYAEELSRVEVAFTPLATGTNERTRFTGSGEVAGGSFKIAGDGVPGQTLAIKVELRDVVVPRANPYLDRFTSWTASRGSLNATAEYVLDGTRLTARHDVVVKNLEVEPSGAGDEVERRTGMPFGFLVSLLKDARGEIKMTLPVSGDIGTREFDFKEAMWGAVRSVALRLVALPFSRIGSLFVSNDSKMEAIALTPVAFAPGSDRLADGMTAHLERVARFMRDAPAVKVSLSPILTQADVDALRREQGAAEEMPTAALQALSARRLAVVRENLTRGGGLDASRLPGRARPRAFIEEGGSPRVELDLRPETQVSESR